jgi:hypothetical protein
MESTTRRSIPGRALAAASLIVGIASLAACADSTTAPTVPTLPATAGAQQALVVNLGAYIKLRIADTTGATLTEKAFVQFFSGKDTVQIQDNAKGDLDPAVGFMKVMVAKTNDYQVRVGRSAHYMPDLDGQVNWKYMATSTSTALTVDMGTFNLQRSPIFNYVAWDEFGQLAGGATFSITTTNPNWTLNLLDNDVHYDESPIKGLLIYTLNFPFMVTICEVKPPPKMVLTSQKCFTFQSKWGQTYTATFTHEHAVY